MSSTGALGIAISRTVTPPDGRNVGRVFMDRGGSLQHPGQQQHRMHHAPASMGFPPAYGGPPQQPMLYLSYPGFLPHQPPPMGFPAGVRPFAAPGFPEGVQPLYYGPPGYIDPATGAFMTPAGPMPPPGQPRPVMPSSMQRGFQQPPPQGPPMQRPAMPGPQAPPSQLLLPGAEGAQRPRQRFLIPGNGVRSNSTSSIRRASIGSARSLPDEGGSGSERNTSAPAAAPPAVAQPPMDPNKEQAPCAFFLKTGTCAYGDRCKFQHMPASSLSMLNSLGLPLRPGQPECQFYTKHMRCGFGASCKYHHPEPAGRQWGMPQAAGGYSMYPVAMPMMPQMMSPHGFGPRPPPTGYAEAGGSSLQSASSTGSLVIHDEPPYQQGPPVGTPQARHTRRRSRLSQGKIDRSQYLGPQLEAAAAAEGAGPATQAPHAAVARPADVPQGAAADSVAPTASEVDALHAELLPPAIQVSSPPPSQAPQRAQQQQQAMSERGPAAEQQPAGQPGPAEAAGMAAATHSSTQPRGTRSVAVQQVSISSQSASNAPASSSAPVGASGAAAGASPAEAPAAATSAAAQQAAAPGEDHITALFRKAYERQQSQAAAGASIAGVSNEAAAAVLPAASADVSVAHNSIDAVAHVLPQAPPTVDTKQGRSAVVAKVTNSAEAPSAATADAETRAVADEESAAATDMEAATAAMEKLEVDSSDGSYCSAESREEP